MTQTSLRDKIQQMAGDADVTEFDNLILDETTIERLSDEDKTYLEQFAKLEMISLNICRLQSLENFPKLPQLSKVELAENQIKGSDLQHLAINQNIKTLKLGNNKIAAVKDLLCLKNLPKLKSLDLEGNPIQETDEYKPEDIFEMLPSLEVLDMKTKDGEDAQDSEDDDDEDDFEGEQGEDEMDEEERVALLEEHLSEKQKAKLQAAGVSIADYLAGNGPDLTDEEEDGDDDDGDADGDYDDEEEGEAEADGDPEDENGPDAAANKPDASGDADDDDKE